MACPLSRSRWNPTDIRRFIKLTPSSTNAMRVATDQGDGFVKAMGNPEGPHALASELVGTQLADWFGLPTFDYSIITIDADQIELRFANRELAQSGPAFITRAVHGIEWGGQRRELKKLANPHDLSRLVVFDTWILNRDRCAPDGIRSANFSNVFLSQEAPEKKFMLMAMDHTHCFGIKGEITRRVADIENRDTLGVFGLFPEFREFLDKDMVEKAASELGQMTRKITQEIVASVPADWEVSSTASRKLVDLIVGRATFVSEHIMKMIWPQQNLPGIEDKGDIS